MATQAITVGAKAPLLVESPQLLRRISAQSPQAQCLYRCRKPHPRHFSYSAKFCRQKPHYKDSFRTRLRKAFGETKIKWYPIPVGLGIGFLGLAQLYKINE